ncbi:hypothetical protein VSU19_08365 [Verrucomicrobiales bacterium BCK34]|nr:hypothetical protein [Verrucomicrobiales bacterium BCK34]
MTDTWPFDQPRNCATVTTKFVIENNRPVTFVSHDEDDHGWQFHSDDEATMDDAMLVSLESIVALDRSLLDVADLQPGWIASRSSANAEWIRRENIETDAET